MRFAQLRRYRFISSGAAMVLAVLFEAGLALRPAAAAPEIVNGRNFAGQSDPSGDPYDAADVAIAVGQTRYIQMVNERFAIYTRANTSTSPTSTGSLTELARFDAVRSFNPQVIWDPTTSRFYYTMVSISQNSGGTYSTSLSWGWSKTASPDSAADFCSHSIGFQGIPDSVTLGDSEHFVLFGLNLLDSTTGKFKDAHLLALGKPAAGTGCDWPLVFNSATLSDTDGNKVFAPVAANGVDPWVWGYAIARNLTLPSNKLWLFPVTRHSSGQPLIGAPKQVPLPFSYDVPPDARQPAIGQKIDTGEAELTQAVIARNPDRGDAFSLWTQHTVRNGAVSAVRWYEIDPFRRPPVLRRSGLITAPGLFLYNAAISPDRRVDGAVRAFGDSFVVHFNRSSASIFPHIRMGSSVSGGPLSFATVVNGFAPYRDSTCPLDDQVCAWGDYAGAAPDPKPFSTAGGTGVVWGTNLFAGTSEWRTQIFAVKP